MHGLEGIELVLDKMIKTAFLFLFIPCADYFVGFYRKTISEAELLAATQSLLLIVVYGVFIYSLSDTISFGHSPADEYEPLSAFLIRVFFYLFLPLILAWYLQVAAKYNSFIQYPTTVIKDSWIFIKPVVLMIIAAYGCSTILQKMHISYYFYDELKDIREFYDRSSFSDSADCELKPLIIAEFRDFFIQMAICYFLYALFSLFISKYIARFCDLDFYQSKALTFSMSNRASFILFAWSFL